MPRLDTQSRDILKFRPNIAFVEPELDTDPDIRAPSEQQLKDLRARKQRIRNLADAVVKLADVVQARADQRAAGFTVALDRKVDFATIQAMKRRFPDDDPTRITYEQYKIAKQNLYDMGDKNGNKVLLTPGEIKRANPKNIGGVGLTKGARDALVEMKLQEISSIYSDDATSAAGGGDDADGGAPGEEAFTDDQLDGVFDGGGYGGPEWDSGGDRPELQSVSSVIDVQDNEKIQFELIKILINRAWKAIRDLLKKVLPDSWVNKTPKRIFPETKAAEKMLAEKGFSLFEGLSLPRRPRDLERTRIGDVV